MAIVSIVLDKPLGANDAGSVIQVDEDTAAQLISSGLAHEATEDEVSGGGDEPDEPVDAEPQMNELKRHLADVTEKATQSVLDKLRYVGDERPRMKATARFESTDPKGRKGGFDRFGDFIVCEMQRERGDPSAVQKMARYTQLRSKGQMSVGVAAAGGTLVPQEWANEIFRLTWDGLPNFLEMCTRIPMQNQSVHLPAIVQASATSGVVANVVAEAAAAPDTQAVTAEVLLTLKKFVVLVNLTDELTRFSPYAVESVIKQHVPEKLRYKTNDDFIRGTNGGVNLIGNAATVPITRAVANRISFEDVNKMEAAMWDSYGNDFVWLTNRGTMPELRRLAFPSTTGNFPIPVFLPPEGGFTGGLTVKPAATLSGRPVYCVENCSALGAKGDLIAVHLPSIYAGYEELDSAMSPYLYFDKAINSFRFILYASSANALTTPYVRQNSGGSASNIAVLDVAA